MQTHRGQFQFRLLRAAVERFDIDQFVLKLVRTGVDPSLCQSKEHEGVIRIRTVPHANKTLRRTQRPSPIVILSSFSNVGIVAQLALLGHRPLATRAEKRRRTVFPARHVDSASGV